MNLKEAVLCLLVLLAPLHAHATTYYVSNQGNDTWSGTSQSQPWQSIDRVNKQSLHAGDQVLFEGEQTFVGSLLLLNKSGTMTNPVVISSYGTGPAWISSGTGVGLFGYNVSGVTVKNLSFVGDGIANTTSGVVLYTDALTGAEGITLTSLSVRGYGKNGVEIGSGGTHAGYRHVDLEAIEADNNRSGVMVYAQYPNAHADVFIDRATTSHNRLAGVVLGGIAGGAIQFSQASNNASGIIVSNSTQIVIHNCVVHHNHAVAGGSGVGIALGQNVSLSTVQYSNTYQNDGPGYLLTNPFLDDNHTDNELLGNVSTNDSRKGPYGAIQTWGRVRNVVILGNIIYASPGSSSGTAALTLANWGIPSHCIDNMIVRRNVFQSTSHLLIVMDDILRCSTRLQFKENTFEGNPFSILWGSTEYTTLAAWMAATGQN